MKYSIGLVLPLALGISLSAFAQTSPATTPASTAPAAASAPATPAAPPASAAPAVEGPSGGPIKIAVINFQMAMAQSNEGQTKFQELQKKWAPKSAELKSLNEEIASMMKEVEAGGSKLTEAERASKNKEIEEKKKKFTRLAGEMRTDGNKDFEELFNALAPKVYQVVSAYAEAHGLTVILDSSQKQTSVVYSTPSLDITKAVIDAYNAKSGVPAPPPMLGEGPVSPEGKPAPKPAVH